MRASIKKHGQGQPDPLYVIFEQHLFNFPDADIDRKTLILRIVSDYLNYLRKLNITVPKSLEQPIIEELGAQVNTMLVKKIYGFGSLDQFQSGVEPSVKRRASAKYSKLQSAKKSSDQT
jgi:hypothetical protein